MKQELFCRKCGLESRVRFPVPTPYPGEYIRHVDGTIRKDTEQEWICDWCSAPLKAGDAATCFSISVKGVNEMFGWEREFMDIDDG